MKYASVPKSSAKVRTGYTWLMFLGVTLALTAPANYASLPASLLPSPSYSVLEKASTRVAQRSSYRLALKDLSQNRTTAFKERQASLANYPLAPYLEYHYLNKNIDKLSSSEMAELRSRFAAYPFMEHLRNRWLLRLPGKGRWSDYLANYEPSRNTTRRCYYLRALYRSGERTAALNQVEPLWVHGESQPKACDPLFDAWIGAGYLKDHHVWERINLALAQNEVSLAKYLRTLLTSKALKSDAEALYEAHVRPQTKFNPNAYGADNHINRAILSAGLQSLARKDPEKAITLWNQVKNSHSFSSEIRSRIETRIYIEAAEEQLYPGESEPGNSLSDSALERIAREAVRQQNWSQADRWIGRMSLENRSQPEWLYWQNRSKGSTLTTPDLTKLAGERNYYGFLTALGQGVETRLNHESSSVAPSVIESVSQQPGVERALELYAVDDLINARREWHAAFAGLSSEHQVAAAQLARQHGWLDQAIRAANAAKLHNDLDLRFPQEFATIYGKASHATNIPPSTLMAVTRQESAFAHNARSHANARGLMQLLPATAKRTAKKAGLRQPTTLDLYEPAINIRIASEHLASLMTRYNQQRPLAFAAYNAGERRVDRWIKDRAGMPMEVWIETIPFRETRGYVKSVLAFNHLYSKRLNEPVPLLLPHELTVN